MKNKAPHLAIIARAGCGKTSTTIDFVNTIINKNYKPLYEPTKQQKDIYKKVSKAKKIICCAFNKAIAVETQEKLPEGVESKTLHSIGMGFLRSHYGKIKVSNDQNNFRMKQLLGYEVSDRMDKKHFDLCTKVCKVVSLLKNFLLEGTKKDIVGLVNHFGIDVNGSIEHIIEYAPKVLKMASEESTGLKYIDFDDMIYLPAKLGIVNKSYDLMIVDEVQDLNPAQHELVCKAAERIVMVGDDRQAIYGFRGSDSDSINTCIQKLKDQGDEVEEYPLNVTWRCPKSHVKAVQHLVPDLEAASDAIEGEIHEIKLDKITEHLSGSNSLVMCRVNAPICQLAFRLIKNGTPCRIQGRDFGAGLISLIKKLNRDDVPAISEELENYRQKEINRILKQKQFNSDMAIQNMEDKCDCILHLSEGLELTSQLIGRIKDLFSEEKLKDQVLLSSGHRSKGLEADDIFILNPELIPHPMAKQPWEIEQENNLYYVMHTRGMKRKFIVYTK